ncbi:MAG: hypothetical protein SPL05_04490 [Eubacteriales bacterium]|nr:hypothetical protein [Eubacteriales bacterium]
MKRFWIICFTVILCLAFCNVAFAASKAKVDVKKLSDKDLEMLYTAVQQEMAKRGLLEGSSYTLSEGKYIVGQDVKPGKYTITCTANEGEQVGDAYASLGGLLGALGEDEESKKYGEAMNSLGGLMGDLINTEVKVLGDYGTAIKSFELKKDQSIDIVLEEKTAIEIVNGTCTLVSIQK